MGINNFLNIEQQIEKLSAQKGLIIEDRDYAESVLLSIGYFSLVTGYKVPFKDVNNNYREGTRLEDIVALFKFDENLRDLFLKYILRVEQHVQTLVAYYFCSKYGESQKHYLNPNTYMITKENKWEVFRLVKELDYIANKSRDRAYVVAERKKGNVPFWVSVNAVSLGTLSKLYRYLATDVKLNIARHFSGVSGAELGYYLELCTDFRNVCAHCECLYNHKAYRKYVKIDGEERNDLYALSYVFRKLLSPEDYKKFQNGFCNITEYFSTHSTVLSKNELLSLMGFNFS